VFLTEVVDFIERNLNLKLGAVLERIVMGKKDARERKATKKLQHAVQ
jgi:hypothetical protein